jgi:hypothetical protein
LPTSEALTQPAADEFELSIFGPGVGECIVLHLGGGEWAVVDSCLDRERKRPVALEYLDRLGVDSASSLRLVVITHWHDDHIRGAADVLAAAPNALFACSAALLRDEFKKLASRARIAGGFSRGVEELGAVFDVLKARQGQDRGRGLGRGLRFASEDKLLFRGSAASAAEVHALSPSSYSIGIAVQSIAALLPKRLAPIEDVLPTPNEAAVALWVTAGCVRVLLGSDLEESRSDQGGWRAIVASPTRPRGRASIIKVPHHGSENADNPDVWSQMLQETPHALLTPFTSGQKPLPSPSDVRRLTARTPHVYCTAPPSERKPRRRSNTVDKMAKLARDRREHATPAGHVRLRMPIDDSREEPRMELFSAALRLG